MKKSAYIRLFLVGMAMGVANIIPGVSGGTIAVVFGIYAQLMDALGNFISDKKRRKEHIKFLIVLFGGSVIAVVALAGLLSWAYQNYPLMTVYFFMGLILGSVPVVINSHSDMRPTPGRGTAMILGVAVVVILAMFQSTGTDGNALVTTFSGYGTGDYFFFLISGVIAASAMIIPGVSGSFILILLGGYWTVLGALSGLPQLLIKYGFPEEVRIRLFILVSLGIGVVIGILGFSRIMDRALKNYPSITLYTILGLIIGSFYQIFPGFSFDLNGFGALVTFVVGVWVSLRFSKNDMNQKA